MSNDLEDIEVTIACIPDVANKTIAITICSEDQNTIIDMDLEQSSCFCEDLCRAVSMIKTGKCQSRCS